MDTEQLFLDAAKAYEKLEEEMKVVRERLTAAMKELGYDKYVQDHGTKAVYKTYRPNGTFVFFKEIDYKRTLLEGEKGGGSNVLAKKEAEGLGFVLK